MLPLILARWWILNFDLLAISLPRHRHGALHLCANAAPSFYSSSSLLDCHDAPTLERWPGRCDVGPLSVLGWGRDQLWSPVLASTLEAFSLEPCLFSSATPRFPSCAQRERYRWHWSNRWFGSERIVRALPQKLPLRRWARGRRPGNPTPIYWPRALDEPDGIWRSKAPSPGPEALQGLSSASCIRVCRRITNWFGWLL
jgi:hypothetical protein